jgi:hypothetical protein
MKHKQVTFRLPESILDQLRLAALTHKLTESQIMSMSLAYTLPRLRHPESPADPYRHGDHEPIQPPQP